MKRATSGKATRRRKWDTFGNRKHSGVPDLRRLPPEVHGLYGPSPTSSSNTIDDHPHLLASPMREVFEAFRKQVLAIDPCVTEEFLKRYVAYKAETNFVDG